MANGKRQYSLPYLAGQMSEIRGRLTRVEVALWGLIAGVAMLWFKKG